jgi:ATP-dependent Clp protease ATP-binding subunit ClpX
MNEIPSREDVEKVVITPEVVLKESAPLYVTRTGGKKAKAEKTIKSSEEKSA